MDRRLIGRLCDWFSGALVLSGLWMIDELLTLARYCGKDCLYPVPLLGPLDQYTAEGLAWIMILGGIGFLFRKEK